MQVTAIHIAAEQRGPLESLTEVEAVAHKGLAGDRKFGGRHPITIVSEQELEKAAAALGTAIEAGSTRRNVTVTGVELPRESGARLRLGDVVVEVHGDCSPCEVMEESVGPGAREALQGRAGITADIVEGGILRVGDAVAVE